MGVFLDLTNQKFGRWNVLEKTNLRNHGNVVWKCQCDCIDKTIKNISASSLRTRRSKSCGCLRKENGIKQQQANNLSQQKYVANFDFFETIDTEEKAYWLGFIAADGCVYKNRLQIALNNKDEKHIEKFIYSLNSSFIIYNYRNESRIHISSQKICTDLLKYGITPRKSLTLDINLELIPENLHRHFWRGMIDGDGCISKNGNSIRAYLLGTEMIINKFMEYLGFFSINSYKQIRKNIFCLWTFGKNSKYMLELLYNNSNIYLDRKYEIYSKIFKIFIAT